MEEVAVSADGIHIHYDVCGHGAPALVFVHGWCCNRGHWRLQMDHFAPRHTVVALDLAGHGESGCERDVWSMAAFGRDVEAVVEQLGLRQVVLVGHSMGGTVVVEAARLMPDRVIGVVGADTFRSLDQIRTNEQVDAVFAAFHRNFRQATREFVRSQMFAPACEAAFVDAMVEALAAAPPRVGIAAGEALFGHDADLRAGLQALRVPAFAINAAYHPTDFEAAQRCGVAVKMMEGVGHFVMLEDPTTFNRLLQGAVEACMAAAAELRRT